MGPRIGLIAGSGAFPLFLLNEIKKRGAFCAVLAVEEGAAAELRDRADVWARVGAGQASEVLSFLRGHRVEEVLFAGKVSPSILFRHSSLDEAGRSLVQSLPDKRPATLIRGVMDFFAGQGFSILDPGPYLEPFFCEEGDLTKTAPSREALDDIAFGWPIARTIADQDIGQTVVVKKGTVVAVEGLEGTDEAILRGGRLAGPGTVVLKVGRTSQSLSVDLPAVGLTTVRRLVEAGASALCLEAGLVPFFERTEAVALAESKGLALTARPRGA